MRTLVTFSLLALFAFTVAGTYLVDTIRLMENDERVSGLIDRDEEGANTERIALSHGNAPNIYWTSDHEFRKDGALYDVIQKETRGDTVIAICVRDQDEENIVAHVSGQVERNTVEGATQSHSRHVSPESPVKEFPVGMHPTSRNDFRLAKYAQASFTSPQTPPLNIPTPPPRG